MNKVVHFEVPADDIGRAKAFYEKSFGWSMVSVPDTDYTIVRTAETDDNNMIKEPGAINGGMFERQSDLPSPVIVVDVDDLDVALEDVKTNGGSVVREKVAVGDMGFVAYFKDTEGNTLGLWQSKKK